MAPLRLGVVDYVIVGIMLSISAGIGVFFRFTGGRQKTTHEFLMAGKDMPILPVAFSLMATYMSAIALLGIPAETYMFGSQVIMWNAGLIIGGALACFMYVPVFFDMEACTAYEYLEKRFGKVTRSVTSLMFSVQMIFYMAVVLYAPSIALNAVTGLSTWTSVLTIASVCTFYCSLGGLKAVLWTDLFQAMLMYVAVFSVIIQGSMNVGGVAKSIDIANKGGRLIFFDFDTSFNTRYTFWNTFLTGIHFSVSTFGTNQAQIQRMLSVRSLKRSLSALVISIPLIGVFITCCVWNGLVIFSLFHECDPMLSPPNATITAQDQLLPYAVLSMFGQWPGLSGLCIAGVFSAALSTISSAVNSLTAVTMEDFIRPYCFCKKLSETWATFVAKIIAVGYGALCLLLTFVVANFRGVLEASNIMFGMLGGPILGVFTLGLLTTRANEKGTLFGLLAGLLLNAWLGFGSFITGIKVATLPRSVEGCSLENGTYSLEIINETMKANQYLFSQEHADEQNRDVFPAYKISFMWFSIFGTLAVLIAGYIGSLVVGCFEEQEEVKPALISPVLRKWYFRSKENKDITELNVRHQEDSNNIRKRQLTDISFIQFQDNLNKDHAS